MTHHRIRGRGRGWGAGPGGRGCVAHLDDPNPNPNPNAHLDDVLDVAVRAEQPVRGVDREAAQVRQVVAARENAQLEEETRLGQG